MTQATKIGNVIVLGEGPAKGYEDCEPIIGTKSGKMCATGNRWVQWAEESGLPWQDFEYYNITGDGRWEKFLNRYNNHQLNSFLYITLGQKAFRELTRPLWFMGNTLPIPHPSGRNRVLNDSTVLKTTLTMLKEEFEHYDWLCGQATTLVIPESRRIKDKYEDRERRLKKHRDKNNAKTKRSYNIK